VGAFKGATNFSQSMYDSGMDIEKKKELWDRLENEPERAYRAFESYRNLPSGERTVIAAYRQHVGNPHAAKPSDTWSRWSSQFAWRERAAAYDAHLDRIRERSIEKAIEEEAERQAREAERMRGRYNELLAHGYLAAMEWLENAQPSDFRPSDIIQITRLHMDAVKAFEVSEEPREEVTWTEEELAELTQIIREIEAEETEEEPEEDSDEGEEDADQSEDEQK
jgi:hypothetical protein